MDFGKKGDLSRMTIHVSTAAYFKRKMPIDDDLYLKERCKFGPTMQGIVVVI